MYDKESEFRIYADLPESLYDNFKHALVNTKIKQKKAVAEALQLWLDNLHNLKSNCMVCGKTIDYKGFIIYNQHSFESAILALKQNMLCDNPECIIEFERTHDIDNYNTLFELHKNDKWDFRDAIWKSWEQNK